MLHAVLTVPTRTYILNDQKKRMEISVKIKLSTAEGDSSLQCTVIRSVIRSAPQMFRVQRLAPSLLRHSYQAHGPLNRNATAVLARRCLSSEAPKRGPSPRGPFSWKSVGFLTIFGGAVLFYFKTEYDEKMKKSEWSTQQQSHA